MNTKLIFIVGLAIIIISIFGLALALLSPSRNNLVNNSKNDKNLETNHLKQNVCWNKVRFSPENRYYWPDGCKGNPEAEICTQALVELTENEILEYLNWINNPYDLDPRCESNIDVNTEDNSNNFNNIDISTNPTYTMDFVKQGNTKDNCVVVYKTRVYQIPEDYQKRHPGGADKIISNCGKDISRIFDISHSGNLALQTLENYYIGDLIE